MKKLFTSILFIFILSVNAQQADYIFKNVNIITMKDNSVLKNKTLVIKDNTIIEISDKTKFTSKNTIDTKGKYLLPAMAEAHVHFPEDEKEFENVLKLNLINGVTKIRSMRASDNTFELINRFEKESYLPKIYASPVPIYRNLNYTTEYFEEYIKNAKDSGFLFIKILGIKSPAILKELDAVCKKYDMKITGHYPDNSKGVRFSDELVFSTNYNAIEHLGGLIGEPENFESRMKLIKEKNVFICPTVHWYEIAYGLLEIDQMLNQRGMEYIPVEVKNDWAEKTKIYREKLGKEAFEEETNRYSLEMQERYSVIKQLHNQGTKLLVGPEGGTRYIVPGFGILEEMKHFRKAGLSNFDILEASTTNFALLFDENYGTIETGKQADFILVDENPLEKLEALEKIESIFHNNQYLDKNKLNEIAESVIRR